MPSVQHRHSTIESLTTLLLKSLPIMTDDSQRLSLSIYHLLAKGLAVSIKQVTEHSGLPSDYIRRELRRIPNTAYNDNTADGNKKDGDQNKSIVSFLGLTINKTDHLLTINHNKLYTWCAWDGFFITELLQSTGVLTSQCPISNESVTLTISGTGIEEADLENACLSMRMPIAEAMHNNLRFHFCDYVKLFSSTQAGQEWCAANEGAFLLSIEQTWQLAQKVNRLRYSEKNWLNQEGNFRL